MRNETKQHLDFIDLAKGICILFVVSYHVDQGELLYRNESVNTFFMSFRIPFYFMLSGLFVSFTHGYKNFLIKKVNRLVVPCVFFFSLTALYALLFSVVRKQLIGEANGEIFDSSLYNFLISENEKFDYPNIPIWFLVSLFTTYMIFLCFDWLTKGRNNYIVLALSIAIGIVGYLLSAYNVQIPCYIDSSMTCMPFVAVGNILRKKTNLLYTTDRKLIIGIAVACILITACVCGGDVTFYRNDYNSTIFSLYFAGCFGSIAMLLIAKLIGYCPIVNYIGRYSIIVLGMHSFFIGLLTPVLTRLTHGDILITKSALLILVVGGCTGCIYVMRRWVPWFVAQKDLI